MGKLLNRSCPAVSHMVNLYNLLSIFTPLICLSIPTVERKEGENLLLIYLDKKVVLPTFESPIKIKLMHDSIE